MDPQDSPRPTLRPLKLALCLLLTLYSIMSANKIPFRAQWGLDFQGVYAHQHCTLLNPYESNGADCHDRDARPLVYPPLLYWMFSWVRPFSFDAALLVWLGTAFVSYLVLYLVWRRPTNRESESLIFWALLGLQFPFLFMIERGNVDFLITILWSLAFYLWSSRRALEAGFLLGLAVPMKLYPILAVLLISISCVFTKPAINRRLMTGTILGVFIGSCLLLPAFLYYGLNNLVVFMKYSRQVDVLSKSIPSLFPSFPWLGSALWISLILFWGWVGRKRWSEAPEVFFASALAMSTFLGNTSYDYNLTTTFPFLFVLFQRIKSPADIFSLAVGITGLVGQFLIVQFSNNVGLWRFCFILFFFVREGLKMFTSLEKPAPFLLPHIEYRNLTIGNSPSHHF